MVTGEVGVDLGSRDIGVAQQLLNVSEGSASSKHVGGKAMPQHVRSYGCLDVDLPGVVLEDEPKALAS